MRSCGGADMDLRKFKLADIPRNKRREAAESK